MTDAWTTLAEQVRDRMRHAASDKAAFERDGHRLNAQVMQGELNMGTAVLGWIDSAQSGMPIADEGERDGEP